MGGAPRTWLPFLSGLTTNPSRHHCLRCGSQKAVPLSLIVRSQAENCPLTLESDNWFLDAAGALLAGSPAHPGPRCTWQLLPGHGADCPCRRRQPGLQHRLFHALQDWEVIWPRGSPWCGLEERWAGLCLALAVHLLKRSRRGDKCEPGPGLSGCPFSPILDPAFLGFRSS